MAELPLTLTSAHTFATRVEAWGVGGILFVTLETSDALAVKAMLPVPVRLPATLTKAMTFASAAVSGVTILPSVAVAFSVIFPPDTLPEARTVMISALMVTSSATTGPKKVTRSSPTSPFTIRSTPGAVNDVMVSKSGAPLSVPRLIVRLIVGAAKLIDSKPGPARR